MALPLRFHTYIFYSDHLKLLYFPNDASINSFILVDIRLSFLFMYICLEGFSRKFGQADFVYVWIILSI